MVSDWVGFATEMNGALKGLHGGGAAEIMGAFSAMAKAAGTPGALDARTKELVALGIAVAVRCEPCIAHHAQAALRHGATRDEVMEALGMAIVMGAGPSVMYAAKAVQAYDQFSAA